VRVVDPICRLAPVGRHANSAGLKLLRDHGNRCATSDRAMSMEQVEQCASATRDDLKWRVTLRPTDLVVSQRNS